VAFAFLLYQFHRLKELIVRTNLRLFGHRFLMDKVVPGGSAIDVTADGVREILEELEYVRTEFERLVTIYDENASVEDRVRDTGILTSAKARDLGVVGFVARASGLNLDCRIHHPFPPYDRINVSIPVLVSGDVHARAWVRVEEIRDSIRIIREILKTLPVGKVLTPLDAPLPDRTGFAAVEGWRGEILYWVQSGPAGEINRCMVRDPSSVNWLGLEQCIHGNIVPDFPVCNKSFNQSYSGNDL
jgi:Ni,Fe-hydrogenase III large subunit